MNWTDRTGQAEPGQEITGQNRQTGQAYWIGRTGQEEQDRQNKTGRTGQKELDRQYRIGRTGQGIGQV
jgi:hypothetical protein